MRLFYGWVVVLSTFEPQTCSSTSKDLYMNILPRFLNVTLALLLGSGAAYANEYDETIELFKHAGESAVFFTDCYAYAVFPTIGAGGLLIGGSAAP
jgi:hypothetical protein